MKLSIILLFFLSGPRLLGAEETILTWSSRPFDPANGQLTEAEDDIWTTKFIPIFENGTVPSIEEGKTLIFGLKFRRGKQFMALKLTSGTGALESFQFVFQHKAAIPATGTLEFTFKFDKIIEGQGNLQNLRIRNKYAEYRGKPGGEGQPGSFRPGLAANDFLAAPNNAPKEVFHDYIKDGTSVVICGLEVSVSPKNIGKRVWDPSTVSLSVDAKDIKIVNVINGVVLEDTGGRRLTEVINDEEVYVCEGDECEVCADDGGMIGEPHILTWGGTWFDFQGECDLVLLYVPNFGGPGVHLYIHVRTTIRYNYSYIENAAISLGEDTLEVVSFGEYALNGIDNANLDDAGATLAGYPIFHSRPSDKEHSFQIEFGPDEMITITTFKDIVSVKIHNAGSSLGYEEGIGLMGAYGSGEMLARNGTTILNDPNEFGQEWQVRDTEPMLFRAVRAPQYPQEKCRLPSSETMEQRRLGQNTITQEAAELACSHLTHDSKEACIFDVLAVGDVDIALAGHY